MKKIIASMTAVAGLALVATAQQSTTLKYEVSLDGVNFSSSVNALPGQTVEVRVRAILNNAPANYVGSLGQIIYSPVVSNWQGGGFTGNGAGGDNVSVQTQGAITNAIGPFGGARSTPVGMVANAPGSYGRIDPFAAASNSSTSYYRGFVGTGSNAGLMRISQAQITNWIGVGATSGSNSLNNVSGRGGIVSGAIGPGTRNASDTPFVSGTDLAIFRFAITLSSSTNVRTLGITTPQAAIGKRLVSGVPGAIDAYWWANATGNDQLITTTVDVMDGAINVVPTPASLALMGLGGLLVARRRR